MEGTVTGPKSGCFSSQLASLGKLNELNLSNTAEQPLPHFSEHFPNHCSFVNSNFTAAFYIHRAETISDQNTSPFLLGLQWQQGGLRVFIHKTFVKTNKKSSCWRLHFRHGPLFIIDLRVLAADDYQKTAGLSCNSLTI